MEIIQYSEAMEGLCINQIKREAGFTMPARHLHNEYELYYLLEGERYYFMGSHTCHVKSGGLVLIDRSQVHQTSQSGQSGHQRIVINFTEEVLSPFFAVTGELSLPLFFSQHGGLLQLDGSERTYVEMLLHQITEELSKKQAGYRHMVLGALSSLLIYAGRRMPSCAASSQPLPPKHKKVDDIALYITEHYTQPLTLEALAEQFFVNKCYLSRIFKESTGFTVVEYIHICRIRRAQQLLASSTQGITQIANLLGYDTITYFERVFKKYTQTSPVKFRNQCKSTQSVT